MTSTIPPAATAIKAVNAWNALQWTSTDVATPYNALVRAYGDDEAQMLVFMVLRANGSSDPEYDAFSLKGVARRQTEERGNPERI